MEVWKDIKGYEGKYQISNYGYVKSLQRMVKSGHGRTRTVIERILKYGLDKDGYPFVIAMDEGIGKNLRIHRLVAEYFIEGYEEGLVVNHIDGDKLNNHQSNLEWCTQKENIDHSWETGLSTHKWENHFNSSLSLDQVKRIREMKKNKEMSQVDMSILFGVSEATISRVINFSCWKGI